MGPQLQYLETVLTCKGNFYAPDFKTHLDDFKCRLQQLIAKGYRLFKFILFSFNPLMPVAISKWLEMIGRSAYILDCTFTTALHSDINQTAGLGWSAKSGQFIGQFTWVKGDPVGVKGLIYVNVDMV